MANVSIDDPNCKSRLVNKHQPQLLLLLLDYLTCAARVLVVFASHVQLARAELDAVSAGGSEMKCRWWP